MVNTRNTSLTRQENEDTPTTSVSDVDALLATLPEECKTVVKVITEIITNRLSEKIVNLQKDLTEKEKAINDLKINVTTLTSRVNVLELHLDDVDQYERRDTVILSGASLPAESTQENTTNIVTQAIKDQLKINIQPGDISVSHRLGTKRQQHNRPIIVKLVNWSLKHDLVGACVQLRPQLYINESLTPKRIDLLSKIELIRKDHKQKFQQCYTQDGRIIVKFRNSTIKHTITNEKHMMDFLEKYPLMLDTYRQHLKRQTAPA